MTDPRSCDRVVHDQFQIVWTTCTVAVHSVIWYASILQIKDDLLSSCSDAVMKTWRWCQDTWVHECWHVMNIGQLTDLWACQEFGIWEWFIWWPAQLWTKMTVQFSTWPRTHVLCESSYWQLRNGQLSQCLWLNISRLFSHLKMKISS